tara:strand:+ start:1065 stop:1202 length:138 start_codon:yes stop_codon:yes gene_type:complete
MKNISRIEKKNFSKIKNMLLGLVLVAILYVLLVIMFIFDGAPFHN